MQYDPIKRSLGNVFNKSVFLRKLFYWLLDLLLLRSWHIHKEIKDWAKTSRKEVHILDAGAGYGQYTYYLSKMNKSWNILAVDVKKEQICDCNTFFQKICKRNVVFRKDDLTKFVQEEAFDFILSVDVMEHILEDVQVFKNFHASMKKGAMLLISTPSDQGGSDVHEHNSPNDGSLSFIDEHVRDGYGIKEIEDKLKKAGFSKVEAYYSYGTPGKISWRLSMKWPIQLLNVSKIFFIVLPVYYAIIYPFAYVLNSLDVRGKHDTGTGLIVKAWK